MSRKERGVYKRIQKDGEVRWDIAFRVADPVTGASKLVNRRGYKTEGEAIAARRKVMKEVEDGSYIAPNRLTIEQFFEDTWLPHMRTQVRASTFAMYSTNANAYIIPRIGSTQLRLLTPQGLNFMYQNLLATGRRRGPGGLSPRSVRIVHVVLHRALQDAVKWGQIPANVADACEPPKGASPEKDVLTPEQVSTLLKHLADDPLYGFWRLAAATGMRRGELLALRWRDVDLDAGSLVVQRSVMIVGHEATVVSATKTKGSRRTISLDPETVTALRRHKAVQAKALLASGLRAHNLMFSENDGELIHPERVTKLFGKHRKAAGLPNASLHGLRHAHATMLLQSGVSVRTVSQRLGHKNPNVTMAVYSHVLPGDDEAAALVGAKALRRAL